MKKQKRQKQRKGFTILEILAVLIIMGLLATLVGTQVFKKVAQAKVTTTKVNLQTLNGAVNQFYMDTGRYPTEEEGLQILIEPTSDIEGYDPAGYLDKTEIPKDGWGYDFIYELNPESGKPFVIKSYGADGVEGGEGDDKDLYSTDAR